MPRDRRGLRACRESWLASWSDGTSGAGARSSTPSRTWIARAARRRVSPPTATPTPTRADRRTVRPRSGRGTAAATSYYHHHDDASCHHGDYYDNYHHDQYHASRPCSQARARSSDPAHIHRLTPPERPKSGPRLERTVVRTGLKRRWRAAASRPSSRQSTESPLRRTHHLREQPARAPQDAISIDLGTHHRARPSISALADIDERSVWSPPNGIRSSAQRVLLVMHGRGVVPRPGGWWQGSRR